MWLVVVWLVTPSSLYRSIFSYIPPRAIAGAEILGVAKEKFNALGLELRVKQYKWTVHKTNRIYSTCKRWQGGNWWSPESTGVV